MDSTSQMKAWIVSDRKGDGYNYVVYAETRGKAIAMAMHYTDGAFDDYTYTEICASRSKPLDSYYYGKAVLEWNDEQDRGAMVNLAGFYCGYEYDPSAAECAECLGKHKCRRYAEKHPETPEEMRRE